MRFLTIFFLALTLPAQEPVQATTRRFHMGARLTLVSPQISGDGGYATTSQPPTRTEIRTRSSGAGFGGGVTFGWMLTPQLSINGDVLYRRMGFQTRTDYFEGIDDPATTAEERDRTSTYEHTRAGFVDVPLLFRLSNHAQAGGRTQAFLSGGMSFRFVHGISTYRAFGFPDGTTSSSAAAAEAAHGATAGVVLGAGVRRPAGSRIVFSPELRLTRWFRNVFDSPPAHSARTQLELLLGITF